MSSIWQLTMYVQNSTYGKSSSVAYGGATTAQGAMDKLRELAEKRSSLLGTQDGATYPTGTDATPAGLGGPVIEWLRVRDAKDPRAMKVLPCPSDIGNPDPPPANKDNSADPLWNGIGVNLYATYTAGGRNIRRRMVHTIVGFPDRAIDKGSIFYGCTFGGTAPNTLGARLRDYLVYLTAASNQFGIVGADPEQTPKQIAAYDLQDSGAVRCTVTAHGYSTGDRVKLTGSGSKYLAKQWQVIVVDANTIELVNSQRTAARMPSKLGKVTRVALADGTRCVAFYPFDVLPNNLQIKDYGFVNRERRRSKRFVGVSFGRRVRLEK